MPYNRVALFGGSFDPPHVGHQLVISYLMGATDIDTVCVIPTYKHALGKELTSFEHRMKMCQAMISIFDKNYVSVSGAEEHIAVLSKNENHVSLTINLVRYMKSRLPDSRLRLVIGSDLVEQAKTWDEWEEVEKIAPPLIVGRIGYGNEERFMLPNVSSTEIKKSISDGSLHKLVPRTVTEYIKYHGLYGVVGDEHLGKFVFCNEHLYAHSTGWCTVSPLRKIPLQAQTHEDAILEAQQKGLSRVEPKDQVRQ